MWFAEYNIGVNFMSDKKRKRPTKDQFYEFDHLDFANASSANDCTGLVTHFATEDELESYMDIYNFQATPSLYEDESDEKENNIF